MSFTRTDVFLTGTTDHIGGSILTGVLQHSNTANFNITVLIRGDKERVNKLALPNVTLVVGTNASFEIIEKAVKEFDVVIHTSNSSDDLPSIKGLVPSLIKRTHETVKPVIYIVGKNW